MTYSVLAAVSLVLLWLGACAVLPFLALWDRRLAVVRRRSLHDKSAEQLAPLVFFLQLSALAVLGAGWAFGSADGNAGPLPTLMAAACALATLLALGNWLAVRRHSGRSAAVRLATACGGLCALLALAVFVLLPWAATGIPGLAPAESTPAVAGWRNVLAAAQTGLMDGGVLPWLLLILCVCLSAAAAAGLALGWHILRRKADDYGRDYYNFIVRGRASQAAHAGAAALFFAALLLWLGAGALTPTPEAALPPLFGMSAQLPLRLGCLALPLAVLCWYLLARAEFPLQRKAAGVLALPLLWLGTVCLLGGMWV